MAKLTEIDLDDLYFDPQNPRLPNRYKDTDEDQILEYLLLECNLIELMLSIGSHGFFPGEPLLITPRPAGGYYVVEGNRRLGALKLLQPDRKAPVKPGQVAEARKISKHIPTKIPALEFPDRENILSYLGYRHITGINQWDALAKARYLKQLRDRHGDDHNEAHKTLAKEIGSRASHVAKLLTGLNLLERARDSGLLNNIGLQEDDVQFSLLTTGIGYSNICKFIGLESVADVDMPNFKPEEFEEFFRWTFDKSGGKSTVLGESRNFEKLAHIVASERALSELRRSGDITKASLYTSAPLETLRALMRQIEQQLDSAQDTLNIAEGLTQSDVEQATRIKKAAAAFSASTSSLAEDTND